MKNAIDILLLPLLILIFSSCEPQSVRPDTLLIFEIENATNKENVAPGQLPVKIKTAIQEYYFETYIETAAFIPEKGYEVELGTEDKVYFRRDGIEILGLSSAHEPARPGPCGLGRPLGVDAIPAKVLNFISEVYPDAVIQRAKYKGNVLLILIGRRKLLVFDQLGAFSHETSIFYFCRDQGRPILLENLPEAILAFVADNCSEGEIRKAWVINGKIVVGILTEAGRKIMVFDRDGNFLFQRN